jgi:hypothetical protein
MGLNLPSNAETHAAAVRGLTKAAEHLLQVAKTLVPIEEGTLERSGVASVDETTLRAAVSFDTVYAVNQHESMDFRHDNGRIAKYLEVAMLTEGYTLEEILANEIRATVASQTNQPPLFHAPRGREWT